MDFYSVASSRPFTHGQINWRVLLVVTDFFKVLSVKYILEKNISSSSNNIKIFFLLKFEFETYSSAIFCRADMTIGRRLGRQLPNADLNSEA